MKSTLLSLSNPEFFLFQVTVQWFWFLFLFSVSGGGFHLFEVHKCSTTVFWWMLIHLMLLASSCIVWILEEQHIEATRIWEMERGWPGWFRGHHRCLAFCPQWKWHELCEKATQTISMFQKRRWNYNSDWFLIEKWPMDRLLSLEHLWSGIVSMIPRWGFQNGLLINLEWLLYSSFIIYRIILF